MKTGTHVMGRIRLMGLVAMAGFCLSGGGFGSIAAASDRPLPASWFEVEQVDDVKALFSPTLPTGALEIPAAMTAAKVGETITVRGTVAISKDAHGEDLATFILVDESMRKGAAPSKDAMPQTASDIPAEGRMTMQVMDGDGKVMKQRSEFRARLKHGAEVFVTGVVAAANGKDELVVNVKVFHVPHDSMPNGFFVDKAPEAVDVSEARKAGTMKEGDEVVLRGRVGGSKDPFVEGRAVFTLMGRALKACNENPDDKCSVPWDYCCETKADIAANSVTVQVVDGKGRPLRTSMKGRRNLKELSELVVVGKVTSVKGGAVVVSATGAQVTKVE